MTMIGGEPPIGATFSPTWLASIKQDLLTNGFPSSLTKVFGDFGLSDNDIAKMQRKIFALTPADFSGLSIDQGLSQVQGAMQGTAFVPRSVPAPGSLFLVLLGLVELSYLGLIRGNYYLRGRECR